MAIKGEAVAVKGDVEGYPRIHKLQVALGKIYLFLIGWKIEGELPELPKFVLVIAPHTSNWDFPILLAASYAFGLRSGWLGKSQLFRWPFGGLFRWLGGIPVDRGSRQHLVEQVAEYIRREEQVVVAISPEGTRSRAKGWKSGFYHIAQQAEVPLVFGYADYAHKVAGFQECMQPSGDIQADMKVIGKFFGGITAKFPQEVGEIVVRPRDVTS